MKVLQSAKGTVVVELSGSVEPAHGFEATVASVVSSLPYLVNNGYRQSISDAGAMPKGTPEADVKASRRERWEALQAGYVGGQGGTRSPLWARLAASVLDPKLVAGFGPDAKPGTVILALVRADAQAFAAAAKRAKLDLAKVASHVEAKVAWGKREAARRDAEAAEAADSDLA